MKRILTPMLLFVSVLVSPVAIAQTWEYVGGSSSPGSQNRFLSMKLTASGDPVIAFRDAGSDDKATVWKRDTSEISGWQVLGTPGFSQGKADYISLALDPATETVHLAFSDLANGEKASVMKFNGSTWEYLGGAGFTAGVSKQTILAINHSGVPYLAYIGDGLRVVRYNGTTWEPVGNVIATVGSLGTLSFILDHSDHPVIAFTDPDHNDNITVKRFDGTNWQTIGAPGFYGNTPGAYYLSLAEGSAGTLFIAFADGAGGQNFYGSSSEQGSGNAITVKKFNGTDWINVGNPRFTEGNARYVSLALDPSETPYVAFEDRFTGDFKGSVMTFDGADWVYVPGSRFTVEKGINFANIASDASGNLFFAYTGVPLIGARRVFVRKYAAGGSTGIHDALEIPDLAVYPNPAASFITVSNIPGSAILRITDMTGKVVYSAVVNGEQATIDITNLVHGVYLVQVQSNGRIANRKLVVTE